MPQRKLNLTIDPPLGGVSRVTGFQNQPPYTAYSMVNFWTIDADTGRAVLAVRPPLVDIDAPAASGNLLSRVNGVVTGKPVQSLVASGDDGNLYWYDGSVWRSATGAGATAVDTGRAVYAVPYLQQVFIFVADSKPLVFDYPTGICVTLSENAGSCPTDCRGGFVWQSRLWMFGQQSSPHVLYGSRTGDAYDYDFSADITDAGGAFFTGGDEKGLLRGPITAGFAHTSDTAVVSTLEGIVALRGDPRRAGVFEQISAASYILGQGAWCITPEDVVYFLTPLGLMRLEPTPGSVAIPVSRKAIPDSLVGLSYTYTDPTISMCYCSRWNAIYICDRKSGSEQAWAYRIDTGAFEQMTFTDYPYVMVEHKPFITSDTSGVVFGKV